mmetsp:Transcript_21988/g.41406  ORF Transcript_21988/g.41406 Transcript_21988/m.41406 type:complete len:171 (-) Transcript_21988:23-535(-)
MASDNTTPLPASLSGITVQELQSAPVLFLKNRGISDSDCAALAPHLSRNKALRHLYIGYNDFGDEGAKHLCLALAEIDGGCLELVGMRHCRLGDGSAEFVANLIKRSRTLLEIGIDENQIGDAGAEVLANALHDCHALKQIYLGQNQISKASEDKLMSAKPNDISVCFRR